MERNREEVKNCAVEASRLKVEVRKASARKIEQKKLLAKIRGVCMWLPLNRIVLRKDDILCHSIILLSIYIIAIICEVEGKK